MYTIGQKVIHKRTGATGTIVTFNQTYKPTRDKTYYHILVAGSDGREWIANNRQVEILAQEVEKENEHAG